MTIEFEETTDPTGLEVHDSLEQRHLQIQTNGTVSRDSIDPDEFCFTVDETCTLETDEIVFDQLYAATLHDETGTAEANFEAGDTVQLDDDVQFIGLSGPIKLYVRIDVPGTIDINLRSLQISLVRETGVEVGARSLHDRPVGTITTPSDLDSLARAISAVPSALKTTSPERTWPTLRGHPPLIELGDRFEVPSEIDPPEGEVELVVPPEEIAIYQAAPLAFFLGATVRLGENSRLATPRFERSLLEEGNVGDGIAKLLKRFFFLDCLTRTEGIFQYDIIERATLEGKLPFDFADTYDEPLPVRLERYLEVPYEVIEPHVPRWPLTAYVPDEPESVELIPFVVNELGIVREARGQTPKAVPQPEPTTAQMVRSATEYRSAPPHDRETAFVAPDIVDESVEHAWFGDAIPHNASKATIEAYRNQIDRDARSESIEILLICNDARMIAEHDLLDETYGNREELPFEIRSEFGVDTDQFASLLTDGGYDFLHYIGHATEDGIRCPDDDLDVRDLESIDLGVFFLNACRSYEQGLALTRRGAFGGVSTYSDVINEDAVEAGEALARLLNRGFSLRGALEIAQQNTALGEQYLIVGDGSADIAQSNAGPPGIIDLDRRSDDEFGFAIRSYSTKEYKLGTATASDLESVADTHLSPKYTPHAAVGAQSIQEYLTWTELPVLLDGRLRWNDGIGSPQLD
ncbi:hypothetical protein [Natrarchaeobius chitinivorans]|uniref:CHAT domain-containing protein n=1 Tax=Natrarchaeobius chitinivorans TaxID=1679083 RepID=A0A3N6M7E7_NATCH|nr:hypothetical protein [Natrarchaeobius chitinivorans]RQG92070.1 hypothetical protein EA473_17580 [Natrarchaeobius chitinivorans]